MWLSYKRYSTPFDVPMIWRQSTDYINNCYFYMVSSNYKGMSKKKIMTGKYANIPSAIRPVPHGNGLPVLKVPESLFDNSTEEEKEVCGRA